MNTGDQSVLEIFLKEPAAGFEPVSPPWKGGMLTVAPRRHHLWILQDLNPQPSGYEPPALTC